VRSLSMILLSLAKHHIIRPVWLYCRAKVEGNPSNACNLVVCSCSLPWLTYGCELATLPDPTVGLTAINLVYCREPVNRKRFNDHSPRDGQRLRAFFTTKTLEGTAPYSFLFLGSALYLNRNQSLLQSCH
jgi:hypothetical protein